MLSSLLNALFVSSELEKLRVSLQSWVAVLQMLLSVLLAKPSSEDLKTLLLISALLVLLLLALLFSSGSRVKSSQLIRHAPSFTSAEQLKTYFQKSK
jgi:hypothetical protein